MITAPIAPAYRQDYALRGSYAKKPLGTIDPLRNSLDIERQLIKTPPQADGSQSWRAVARQCLNSSVPYYTGYIPSQRAESVQHASQKRCGDDSIEAQFANRVRRSTMGARSMSTPAMIRAEERRKTMRDMEKACMEKASGPTKAPGRRGSMPCAVHLTHEYWVPPMPGYTGYVVGKKAENIMGGNLAYCAKEAARSINERPPRLAPHEEAEYREVVGSLASPEKLQKAIKQVGDHCDRVIVGYRGHLPLMQSEPVFGGSWRRVCDTTKELYKTRPRLDLGNTGFLEA